MLANQPSQVLIIDVQERLMPAMSNATVFSDALRILLSAADHLRVPVTISEQYVRGLGPSIASVRQAAVGATYLEKFDFGCADDVALRERIENLGSVEGRRSLVLAGIEAHICVYWSALGFFQRGFDVYVVDEAITSRCDRDADSARAELRSAGISVIPLETLLFGWCGTSQHPQFKTISALVRDRVR